MKGHAGTHDSDGRPSVAKPGLPEPPLPGAAGALPTARSGYALADGSAHRLSVVPDLSTAQPHSLTLLHSMAMQCSDVGEHTSCSESSSLCECQG